MKHLTDTIVEYIARESEREGTFRYILPSYPPQLLLAVGQGIDEWCSRVASRKITFVYGVAYRLGQEWATSTSVQDRAAFQQLCEHEWYNAENNLTSLRNRVRQPDQEDTLVCVLAGYDHIDDRASLRDFFHLDDRAIWSICLRRSFQPWVESCFRTALDPRDAALDLGRIADALRTVYEQGLADLVGISSYLESLNLAGIDSGSEAYDLVLGNLIAFKLPPMRGLAHKRSKRTLADYVAPAQEFANYSLFLDETARKKAEKALHSFANSPNRREPDAEQLGVFETLDDLLASLERYIDNRSEKDRARLLTADFIYIHDDVLGHKEKKTKTAKASIRRLHGLPPEVFLRALWLTLADYGADTKARAVVPEEDLRSITLRSVLFQHDLDGGRSEEEDEDTGEAKLAPRAFLRQILGGIDRLLEDSIQLGGGEGREPFALHCLLSPDRNDGALATKWTSKAEWTLKFEVILDCGESPLKREFVWCLPPNHPSRLLVSLYAWALDGFRQGGNSLPAYAVPYIPELFMARDSDEVNRLLGVALGQVKGRKCIDLLSAPDIDAADPALASLRKLSAEFQAFLRACEADGLFAALENRYDELRQAYAQACNALLCHWASSTLAPLLLKAFLLVDSHGTDSPHWQWQPCLDCAVATPLHPAVLDMMRHQHSFLCEIFSVNANEGLRQAGGRRFAESAWNRLTDLAQMERPLFGILRNTGAPALDSQVRSYGYTHLLGHCRQPVVELSSRLLLDYEGEDDEEITDAELFQETRASALICHTLQDYLALHPHADDGLAVGAYCGREIQPIIAGIDAFLQESILPGRGERPYGLSITIFSTGRDDSATGRWLDAWRERWQEAELSSSKRHYENCRIAIAYRMVAGERYQEQLTRLLRQTALDIMFFTDLVEDGASRFEGIEVDERADDGFRQFPVLEKVCCAIKGGAAAGQRERVLSHRRFALATLHAEVMARALFPETMNPAQRHAVISQSNFLPWEEVLDAAHKKSAWVVCVDPTIDDQLLRKSMPNGARRREIIGFGTGVGAHGENNYTISTEQFALAYVKEQIGAQLAELFGISNPELCKRIAESLIAEAEGMAGLSVVKATGPSQYVRDYIAYATVRKLLQRDRQAFCDEIISLDAFRHWFSDGQEALRPDLLRLRARIVDGHLDINAQIIECKLAKWSDSHLSEAHDQVAIGLSRLVGRFSPRNEHKQEGVNDRPDQRYWWMQLHRLLASRSSTPKADYKRTLSALERLADGYFSISWQGAVFALWTDRDQNSLQREVEWQLEIEGDEITIPALTAGAGLVQRACLEGYNTQILAGLPAIRRTFQLQSTAQSEVGSVAPSTGPSVDVWPSPQAPGSGIPSGKTKISASGDEPPAGAPHPLEADDLLGASKVAATPEPQIVERVLLGQTSGGKQVFWEFGHPQLPNRHILVFGASGTGKTYTIQALLCELGKAGQNALIVDYTNGFTSHQLEKVVRERLSPKQHLVRKEPLPINPFRQQCDYIDDERLDEDPSTTAQRVTGVFSEVYQIGDQQKSALYTAIRDGLTADSASFNLEALAASLDAMSAAGGPVASSAATALSRIRPFVDMHPFAQEDPASWEAMYIDTKSRCHIVQLAGFSKDIARLITEFSLIDLYRYYRAQGSKDRPRIVVLDEIQNLDHRPGSPLGQMLTEGRKFGFSLVLATQTLSSLDKDARDQLFQASHKLFFKPADTELKSFAQVLADATGDKSEEWVQRLSSLARGECYSLGPARNESTRGLDMKKWFRIRITPLEERF